MPNASVIFATAVKPTFLRITRNAWHTSCPIESRQPITSFEKPATETIIKRAAALGALLE
jgi:hypothetical protein